MRRNFTTYFGLFAVLVAVLSSCRVQQELLYNPTEVAGLSHDLQIPISNTDKEDQKNMLFYAELAGWLDVPYKYAQMSKSGTDCSGFVYQVYKKIYNLDLPRSTAGLSTYKIPKIGQNNLKTGDLVLFATGKNKKTINHVGIYLKNRKFIHASTSRGVIVSSLDENYYKKAYVTAKRPKK